MKYKKLFAVLLSAVMVFSLCAVGAQAAENVTDIVLADEGITVDGSAVSTDPASAVYVGAEIVYYHDGTDAAYGAGSADDMHSAEEAAAHTVVTITQPGTYRLTGSLSAGQIAIDLGEGAKKDPTAVVTLILDNVNVTCTVAPALIFYRVYECGSDEMETASAVVDTTAAGANVIIAAGSNNTFNGSHVAKIYKEGSTKKLHKYDGAFYSRVSMNINGDNGDDSGILNIIADNEGLDSELHLTINGGTIKIESQDDGINTNEDFVSVTTINGGYLEVNAGLGAEGDGIDSNGYLTINGGTVWTMSNPQTPDGGIDADSAITINGGVLYAFGTRNDAADSSSAQPYMELSFASTLPAGTEIKVTDSEGNAVWSAVTRKACQSVTLTVPALALDTVYHVYVNDVLQCYSGNSFGMMGGGMPGMPGGFGGMTPPDMDGGMGGNAPEMPGNGGFDGQMPGMPGGEMNSEMPDLPEMPGGMTPPDMNGDMGGNPPEMPGTGGDFGGGMPGGDMTPPDMNGGFGGGMGDQTADGSGSTEFILTETTKSFSGVCDSEQSGKTRVTFTVDGVERSGRETVIRSITGITSSVEIDPSLVQITVADDPSEDYSASCLLSDGMEVVNALLPETDGDYTLTVAVISGDENYTGATQISFRVGVLPFLDVDENNEYYGAIQAVYKVGIMNGISENTFAVDGCATRAQAVAVLARLAGAEGSTTDAFRDVSENAWYASVVGWAYENGIVQGDGTGNFLPEASVSAEDMLAMIERCAQVMDREYEVHTSFTGILERGQMAQMLADLL